MDSFDQHRNDYTNGRLDIPQLDKDPIRQFKHWLDIALKKEQNEVNAIALATADKKGFPTVRYVLLKGFNSKGFVFYTNYSSKKGKDLKDNPFASFAMYWPNSQQQVRVEGRVELLSPKESDGYFDSRPEGSKIGAWASPQSQKIPSWEFLMELKQEFIERNNGLSIKRPYYWGGLRLVPDRFEFWQGRPDRLHDRFEYIANGKKWQINRLAP